MDSSLKSIDPDAPGHGVREQQGDTSPPSSVNRAVIAGAIGNFVECFDWFAYALFASYLSRLVFPSGDPLGALLSTFAVFAIGFFVRPLGSFIFGIYADRYGRKNALAATIFLMATGSLMIAIVPSFQQAGWLAPAMLLLARLMQGLAMGGETSSGGSYIVESAPMHRRGFSGSFFYISVGLGTLCASLTGTFLTYLLPKDQMESYGWRLVFVLGALLGIFGLYLRRSIGESEVFKRAARTTSKKDRGSLRAVMLNHWPGVLRVFFLAIGTTMAFYIWAAYIPNLLRASGRISASTSFLASTFGLIAYSVSMPISGALADLVGRRLVLGSSWLLFAALFIPMIHYALGNPESLPWIMVVAMSLIGLGSGAVAASFAEQFPTSVRAIGWGVPYNVSIAVFGGTAPYLGSWLASKGMPDLFNWYVVALCVISGLAAFGLQDLRGRPLD